MILTLFMLVTFCFFGWRASSIYALPKDAVHRYLGNSTLCVLDVYELKGKHVKAGKPKLMGRLSFP